MSSEPITIDIISDVVCPWCFIGKRNLESALRAWREQHPEDAVQVRWHPFQLNPDLPAQGMTRRQYLERKFGGPERAKEIYARVEAAGRRAGIEFDFAAIAVQPNTVDAHRLMHLAAQHEHQDEMAEALFSGYFLEGANLADAGALAALAQRAGLPAAQAREYLAGGADRDLIEEQDRRAHAIGVEGVPFFIFNQRVALSGAQPPEVMVRTMEQSAQAPAAVQQGG
ncbi:MAG TPA: DsbA family oxidoreductase [Burkholderiales bacterium]|nr:DsbA family oxidoreductase [Burkholderiales bacterium]